MAGVMPVALPAALDVKMSAKVADGAKKQKTKQEGVRWGLGDEGTKLSSQWLGRGCVAMGGRDG